MARLDILSFGLLLLVVGLLTAPHFTMSLLIGVGVILYGLRWFVRSARRGWRR